MAVFYVGGNAPDGTCLGYDSTEKIAFLGATPVSRQANTTDLKDLLVTFGLLTDSGATALNLDGGALTATSLTVTDLSLGNDMTITDAGNIILAATTGTMIGTATTQKVGFLGATPVSQKANTTDLKDTLVAFGFVADSGATPLNLDGGNLTCSNVTCTNLAATTLTANLAVSNSVNIALATTNGTKIGTATDQKLGFYNVTPVIQPASASQAAVTNTTTTTSTTTALTTDLDAVRVLVNKMRADLVALGLIKGAA